MQFFLVLQWLADSEADYEALASMEDSLESNLDESYGYVDGHDFGSGEMNLFIYTDLPRDAFREAQGILGTDPYWAHVRAAYRSVEGEDFTVLWPETLRSFSVS